jgi:hypothetical protein
MSDDHMEEKVVPFAAKIASPPSASPPGARTPEPTDRERASLRVAALADEHLFVSKGWVSGYKEFCEAVLTEWPQIAGVATVYAVETADGRLSSLWASEGEADQARRLATSPSAYRVTRWSLLGSPVAGAAGGGRENLIAYLLDTFDGVMPTTRGWTEADRREWFGKVADDIAALRHNE